MKNPPACWICLFGVLSLLPLVGCGGSGTAGGALTDQGQIGDAYTPPSTPPPATDPQESWKKFYAQAKSLDRIKAAKETWLLTAPGGELQLRFLKEEMQYCKFGNAGPPGTDPNRIYEVGVVTLAAKENYGSRGQEIREYQLQFLRNGSEAEWSFLSGVFWVSTKEGQPTPFETGKPHILSNAEFELGFLKQVFVKPFVANEESKSQGGAGGDRAVESK